MVIISTGVIKWKLYQVLVKRMLKNFYCYPLLAVWSTQILSFFEPSFSHLKKVWVWDPVYLYYRILVKDKWKNAYNGVLQMMKYYLNVISYYSHMEVFWKVNSTNKTVIIIKSKFLCNVLLSWGHSQHLWFL